MNWYQIRAYIKYRLKSKYRPSDSLFVSDLFDKVFWESYPYYGFETIDILRDMLLRSKQKIAVTDLGAGSKKFKGNQRSVRHLVKYNASPKKQGELLFRLTAYLKPHNIIELGTSLGLGTLYLALPNSKARVFTIEGCPEIANVAAQSFKSVQAKNIKQQIGSFRDELPKLINKIDEVDLVYFDGHHDYHATMDYFHICLPKASKSAVFVFDDIHWSRGMTKAWGQISANPAVSVSLDFFDFGIAILNSDTEKMHGVVKWM